MGRYIDWEDVIDRYPALNSIGGSDQMSSAYIVYSEAMVDGLLSSHFTVPFSNNNMIVRDLAIDNVYWRAARFKLDDAVDVKSEFYATIQKLKNRELTMFDQAGTEIQAVEVSAGIYSSTQSYHSAFGSDEPQYWSVDSDQMQADQDRRD